jgi:hypothetical protein
MKGSRPARFEPWHLASKKAGAVALFFLKKSSMKGNLFSELGDSQFSAELLCGPARFVEVTLQSSMRFPYGAGAAHGGLLFWIALLSAEEEKHAPKQTCGSMCPV